LRKEVFFNNSTQKYRVLVAPLDWGLGHATRCIPIIKELINLNCEVLIAANKKDYLLLKKEFPNTVFLPCKGYEIKYSRSKKYFSLQLFLQFPKIIFSIFHERRWLKKTIKLHSIDAVISDNRFGMYHKNIPSIYITHQLSIKTGNQFSEMIAQKIHNYFIKKYSACWVPDEKTNGLAGQLSHPKKIPGNVFYIGPLSRFKPIKNPEKIYDLLITISGPEPQRSIFEKIIIHQLKEFSGKALVIRGIPTEENFYSSLNDSVTIVNHLPADELNKVIEQSKIVISRSGYTTIMDLAALRKKAVLIPTPGQTEQEYLANYLSEKKYFFTVKQNDFSLKETLEKFSSFPFQVFNFSNEEYKKTITEFVLSLKSRNFANQ
jgi:uncharacterized protein (TIGR00661 family)